MKRLMIDVDDVIVDYHGYLGLVNEFLKSNYTINDVKSYYIQDLVPENLREKFTEFFITKNIYDYSKIHSDCVETIKELNEKYDIYSAYVFRDNISYSADSLKHKFEFLLKNLPFLDPNKFTFQTNKSILNCEIKIDDKMENLKNAEIKLLYTAYHNENISDDELRKENIIRVNNWKEIRKILLES